MALELAKYPAFRDKRILLIDRDDKTRNDRTWCFWATDTEDLPPVIFQQWEQCRFFSATFQTTLQLAPYRYCMVRGLDFYNWAKKELAQYAHIQQFTAQIISIDAGIGTVETDQGTFTAAWILNSALTATPLLPAANSLYPNPPLTPIAQAKKPDNFTWLLQHFKGWIIETGKPVFEPNIATLMDYRLDQKGETRFVYVLPFTPTRALVEFTVFSPRLCEAEEYDQQLRLYIEQLLHITDFQVVETEFGVIPMTDYAFKPPADGRVINIGIAGGFVKASSGYAFKRTQRKLRAFAAAWAATGAPDTALLQSPWRFRAFDSIFLRVLRNDNSLGGRIFSDLFRHLPTELVFRFLDEDVTGWEQIRLASGAPTWAFTRAAFQQSNLLRHV